MRGSPAGVGGRSRAVLIILVDGGAPARRGVRSWREVKSRSDCEAGSSLPFSPEHTASEPGRADLCVSSMGEGRGQGPLTSSSQSALQREQCGAPLKRTSRQQEKTCQPQKRL